MKKSLEKNNDTLEIYKEGLKLNRTYGGQQKRDIGTNRRISVLNTTKDNGCP